MNGNSFAKQRIVFGRKRVMPRPAGWFPPKVLLLLALCSVLRVYSLKQFGYERPQGLSYRVGADGGEGTPVPIPNTAVKLTCAENTWLEAAWEDK